MTMNLNLRAYCFPAYQVGDDHDHDQHQNKTDFAADCSLSSVPYHIFFGSSQDHMGGYDQSDGNCAFSQGGSGSSETVNNVENGLKLTLWTMEDQGHVAQMSNSPDVKLMPSNIKTIEKMKTEPSLDRSGGSNSSYNSSPTRVCVDCNTSKTPLWRSGPKGPKSLCNACGIRQRKARQAAVAATASVVMAASAYQPKAIKIKVQHKEGSAKNRQIIKRRCKTVVPATDDDIGIGHKKLCFEDFLVTLSKRLSFQRVFPDDVKDAAILLMALSSGLVHG